MLFSGKLKVGELQYSEKTINNRKLKSGPWTISLLNTSVRWSWVSRTVVPGLWLLSGPSCGPAGCGGSPSPPAGFPGPPAAVSASPRPPWRRAAVPAPECGGSCTGTSGRAALCAEEEKEGAVRTQVRPIRPGLIWLVSAQVSLRSVGEVQ